MDPTATLRRVRELFEAWRTRILTDDEEYELVEGWEALDAWMSNGGFSPWLNDERDLGHPPLLRGIT